MGDVWDDAAAKGNSTATATPPSPQQSQSQQSDSGDIWDQAAQRPIPPPLEPPKDPNVQSDSGFLTPEALKYVPQGIAKSAGQTITTGASLLNKVLPESVSKSLGVQSMASPEMKQQMETTAEPGSQEEMGEQFGAGMENVFEFYLGDAALKGLSIADKALGAARLMKAVEGSPAASKALQLGMRAVRGATTGVGVAKLHGASNEEAAEAAVLGGATEFGQGLADRVGTHLAEAKNSEEAMPPHEAAARNLTKAVNPQLSEWPNYMRANADEAGNVTAFARENNRPLHTQLDYGKAARAAAKETHSVYRDKILDPVGNDIVSVEGSNFQGPTVGGGQDATLNAIDRRISKIGDELRPAYVKTETGKVMTAVANEAELQAERLALTQILVKELSARTGVSPEDITAIRQRFGKMYTIADETEAAVNQRQSTVGRQKEGRRDVPLTVTSAGIETFNQLFRGGPEGIGDKAFRKVLPDLENIPTNDLPKVQPKIKSVKERAALSTKSQELRRTLQSNPSALETVTPHPQPAPSTSGLAKTVAAPPQASELQYRPQPTAVGSEALGRVGPSAPPQAEELSRRPLPASEPASKKQFERSTPGALSDKAKREEAIRKAKAKAAKSEEEE